MTSPRMTGANTAAAALLVFTVLGCGACHRHTVHAAPPVTNAPVEKTPAPTQPPPSTPTPPEKKSDAKPEETAPNPPAVNPAPQPTPPKPRPSPPPTTTPETPQPPKPPAPQIRPRLSPARVAALQRKTNDAIAEAEKNLQGAYGRPLTEAQRDLIEKIRGFISQAREAGDDADWSRASNLAEKARVLSIELANSLQGSGTSLQSSYLGPAPRNS